MEQKLAAAMRSIDVVQKECQRIIMELAKPGCDTGRLTIEMLNMQRRLATLDKQLEALDPQATEPVKEIKALDITHVALTERGFELGGHEK